MSLLDDAVADTGGAAPLCSVALLAATNPELADEVEAAVASGKASLAAISRVLKAKHDVRISGGTLGRHRAGDCSCL